MCGCPWETSLQCSLFLTQINLKHLSSLCTKFIIVDRCSILLFIISLEFYWLISLLFYQEMFLIVIFESTNEVEVVPDIWVKNNTCLWPPYKREETVKAVKSQEPPGARWIPYKVRIILSKGRKKTIFYLHFLYMKSSEAKAY